MNLQTISEAFNIRKRKKPKSIEELLQPINNLDIEILGHIREIEDIFEEFHKNSYLKRDPITKKYLSKYEADQKTVEQFTDEFKRTIKNLRKELKINKSLIHKELEEIKTITQTNPTFKPQKLSDSFQELIDSIAALYYENKELEPQESCSSLISGVWKILEAIETKTFRISPPEYDAYRQEQPHWLQRVSISWEDVEKSRIKCEKWLQEQC